MRQDIIDKVDAEEARIFTANKHNAEAKLNELAKDIADSEDGEPIANVEEAIDLVTGLNGDIEKGQVSDAEILRRIGWYRATTLQKRPADFDKARWDPKLDLRFIVVPDKFKHVDGKIRDGYRLIVGNFAADASISTNRIYTAGSLDEVEKILVRVYRPVLAGTNGSAVKLNPATGWVENTIHSLVGQSADIPRLHRYIGAVLLPELNAKLEIERKRDERVRQQYVPTVEEPEDDEDFFTSVRNPADDAFVAVASDENLEVVDPTPAPKRGGFLSRLRGPAQSDRPYLYGNQRAADAAALAALDEVEAPEDDVEAPTEVLDTVDEVVELDETPATVEEYEAPAVDDDVVVNEDSDDTDADDDATIDEVEAADEAVDAYEDNLAIKISDVNDDLPAVQYVNNVTPVGDVPAEQATDEFAPVPEAEALEVLENEGGEVLDLIEADDSETTEIPVVSDDDEDNKGFRFGW